MADPLFSVADKTILVSGGSRGIGAALARGFAQRDARVWITGRDAATLEAAAREISTGAHLVQCVVCDVADPQAIIQTVDQVNEAAGHIDVLLNVAGVNIRQPVESFTEEQFDFVLDINLKGAFLMAQAVGKKMIAQGTGAIINIDSLNTHAPLKNVTPYAISKCGLNGMTKALAKEWGSHGVRVNGLAPGFILTDLTQKLWSDPVMQKWGVDNTAMGRLGGSRGFDWNSHLSRSGGVPHFSQGKPSMLMADSFADRTGRFQATVDNSVRAIHIP